MAFVGPQKHSRRSAVVQAALNIVRGFGSAVGKFYLHRQRLSWRIPIATGALVGMGIPEYEAKRYEGRLQKGGILLSAHCDTSEEIKRAKEIMERSGAEDISSTGETSVDAKKGETTRTPAQN
jgi:hypothetical protein